LDKAGWHISKNILLPDNLFLMHLPPYSPELNPVELLWREIRM
jgi:transposase